ncbi:MAG: hypothetical protein AAFO88_06070 [Pseudomonadota bacterium]
MTHKNVRAMLFGICFAYLILGGLLFAVHETPLAMLLDLSGPFAISMIGIATAFLAYREPATEISTRSRANSFTCAGRTTPLQAIALTASGFFLGALLFHLFKLIA